MEVGGFGNAGSREKNDTKPNQPDFVPVDQSTFVAIAHSLEQFCCPIIQSRTTLSREFTFAAATMISAYKQAPSETQ
jgi:hypothetical protein